MKTKIGTEVAHITQWFGHHFQGQGHQATLLNCHVKASGSCSGQRGNLLAVGKLLLRCVSSATWGASAPTEEERGGGGISWRPPAYSLLTILLLNIYFRTSSLNVLLNHFLLCPLLPPSNIWKNNSLFISITVLYWNQYAVIKTKDWKSRRIYIRRGIRQGCIIPPILLNLYSE